MRRVLVAALVLAAACRQPKPAPAFPARLAGPGARLPAGVRPTRQALDLRINPSAKSFTGRATIDVVVAQPTEVIWLNAEEITITSARIVTGGVSRAVSSHPHGDVVGLQPARPLAPGAATLVRSRLCAPISSTWSPAPAPTRSSPRRRSRSPPAPAAPTCPPSPGCASTIDAPSCARSSSPPSSSAPSAPRSSPRPSNTSRSR